MAKDVAPSKNFLDIHNEVTDDENLQKINKDHDYIMRLNDDCLLHIVRLLTEREQVIFAKTCRRFHNIVLLSSNNKYRKYEIKFINDMPSLELRDIFEVFGVLMEEISCLNCDEMLGFILKFCGNAKSIHVQQFNNSTLGISRIIDNIKSIEELCLKRCCINDDMLESMAKLPNLKNLMISTNNKLTGKNLNLLVNLTSLNISKCAGIEEANLIEMCKSLVQLKELNVSGCKNFSSNVFAELVKNLRELESLKFSNEAEGYEAICELPKLKKIKLSFIMPTAMNPQFLKNLMRYKCDQLESLVFVGRNKLSHENINDIGCFVKLRKLSCSNNESLDDNCLRKWSNLVELEDLDVSGSNQLNDDALLDLVTKCTNLKSLNIRYCKSLSDKFILKVIEVLKSRGAPPKEPLTIYTVKSKRTNHIKSNEYVKIAHFFFWNYYLTGYYGFMVT